MRKKPKIKPTSILAYYEVLKSLGERQAEVYKAIRELESCNNTMIAKHLNLPINCICGRTNELRKYGVVMEDKKAICPYTKKLTIFWRVRRRL